ncbi:hypothetical protein DB34_06625 [Acetobacter pasteurianus]|nr:hypothetical protein DB34_06625 [Acetobacter pasteurianus]
MLLYSASLRSVRHSCAAASWGVSAGLGMGHALVSSALLLPYCAGACNRGACTAALSLCAACCCGVIWGFSACF